MHHRRLRRSVIACVIAASLSALFIVGARAMTTGADSSGNATGNQYYVASAGSDTSGDGSAQKPWASIDHAASALTVASDGATVHVAPGTYTTTVENTQSGTANGYLTFVSDVRWGAHIATGGGLRDFPFRNDGSYVRIIGFDITSTTAWSGILSYGTHNVIQGNHVHDIDPPCSGSPGGQGIGDDASASDNTIDGNTVDHIGPYPSACEYVQGIYPSGAGDVVVNNISYDNSGSGITFNHNSAGATISNNLCFANGNHGISISSGGGSGDNFVITNNITRDNAMFGVNVHSDANGPDNQYRNNLFDGNGKGTYGLDNSAGNWTPPNTSGTVSADPDFVNYQSDESGDYHLAAGSPAIDAGTSLGAPATDYDGVNRPQGAGYDIGPYEYPTSTSTPTGTPAPSGTPTSTPRGTPTPTGSTIEIGFEDGTSDGWGGFYGNANPSVTTAEAYEGAHALLFDLSSGGHSAVGTTHNISGLTTGSTVTYHLWANQPGTTVQPFIRDTQYTPIMAGNTVTLPAQQWVTVTWQVPASSNGIGAIGIDASPGSGTVAMDGLSWPSN